VIKSYVRNLLEKSAFSSEYVDSFYRGEEGSPYTLPNPGETIVMLKNDQRVSKISQVKMLDFDEDEAREAKRNSKAIRADRLRTARRR